MSFKVDPVKQAIEVFMEIKKEIGSEDEGSKLRARAREIPGLVESMGLVPALSFCYAKAKEGAEAKSYKLYLKAVLTYLNKLGFVEKNVDDALKKPDEVLNELYPKAVFIIPFLRPFMIQFKRLCEATWEAKER